jgi:type IV pilus assembly protein PilM
MAPYNGANIEVDVIQLAPIAIYNYIAHDVAKELPEGQEYSSESPPPSLVVLSIGTDTTDLVVTNGYRVWQRNIPLGGNHFTRQLSKELKLTFAKAEHLKRNPKQADDPKAIFQAMRPVFADMVTEVQRSIGFFQSLDRKAKISSVVMLGNTVKLPGLVQYLSKHLGYDVKEIDSFNKLGGAAVVTAPSFKDNVLAFGTCYGLCLQGLGKAKLSTNLLPREILTQRLIRAKKPWAIAGVSALVLACALNYAFWYNRWWEVHEQRPVDGVTWQQAVSTGNGVSEESKKWLAEDEAKKQQLEVLKKIGTEVVGSADRRVLWLEVMKAINKSLPPMADNLDPKAPTPDFKTLPFEKRKDLKIIWTETQFFPDLAMWFTPLVKQKYLELNPELLKAPPPAADGSVPADGSAPPADAAAAPVDPSMDPSAAGMDPSMAMPMDGGMPGGGYGDGTMTEIGPTSDLSGVTVAGPTGPGWVVELAGYHYHNDPKDRTNYGPLHVRNTLLRQLDEGFVDVPKGPGQAPERFTMKELGIGYAILAHSARPKKIWKENFLYVPPVNTTGVPGATPMPGAAPGVMGPGGATPFGGMSGDGVTPVVQDPNNPTHFQVSVYEFVVQFVWQEKPLLVRLDERKKAQEAAAAAKAAAEAAAAAGGEPAEGGQPPAPPAEPPAAEAGAGIPANDPGLQLPEEPAGPPPAGPGVPPEGAAVPPGVAPPAAPQPGAGPPAAGPPGPAAVPNPTTPSAP